MMHLMWLGEIAWKGSVLLVIAFIAAAWLRRSSASARHLLWTIALGTLLLLPAAILVAPQWRVAPPVHAAPAQVAASGSVAGATVTVTPRTTRPFRYSWLLVWIAGGTAACLWFVTGTLRTRWILRGAHRAAYAETILSELAGGSRREVQVFESAEVPVPIACGMFRPVIVLPRGAADWNHARLRTVIRHELAHIERHDLAAQLVGQAACCLYWFHPLVWIAARRLRQEREHACDDAVLASGIPADEYANALVELARGLAARRQLWMNAPAMAEVSSMETRIRALFDRRCDRSPIRASTAAAIGAAAFALLLPMASLTLNAQPNRGMIAGVVEDPSGARVPFCRVAATNQSGSNQEFTKADAAGEYRFNAIPAGHYVLEFAAPGFAKTKAEVQLAAGHAAQANATLELGSVSERLTISGQKPIPMARSSATPQRIRVGGNVQPVRLIEQVKPEYPAALQQSGVQGTVVIRAVISMDGNVLSPQVVNTDVDPRLAQLALDAVKQWRYQPSLLNGEPVETTTTMTIDFTLDN